MAFTLKELRERLRLRLGDPSGNFISKSATYTDASNPIDEEAMIINDSARQVTADLYRNGVSLLTGRQELALEPNQTEYALPADTLGVQEVFWNTSNIRHEVEQRPLQSFQDIDQVGSRPEKFDVWGQAAEVVATTYAAADTYIGDSTYADHTVKIGNYYNERGEAKSTDFSAIKTGDILHNLDDDSQGVITTQPLTDTATPNNYYLTAKLTGGKANFTRYGDRVQIERADKTLPLLHIWPTVERSELVEVVQTGVVSDFLNNNVYVSVRNSNRATTTIPAVKGGGTLTDLAPFYLYGVRLTGGSPDGRRSILGIDELSNSGNWTSSLKSVASQYFIRESSGSVIIKPNQPVFISDRGGESSDATSSIYEFAFSSGDPSFTDCTYEILRLKHNERLQVYYARYPNRLVEPSNANDAQPTLELPEIALEAMMCYAEYLCYLKAEGGRNNLSSQAYALYELQLQKIQKFQRTRNIRGSRQVRNVMYGVGSF